MSNEHWLFESVSTTIHNPDRNLPASHGRMVTQNLDQASGFRAFVLLRKSAHELRISSASISTLVHQRSDGVLAKMKSSRSPFSESGKGGKHTVHG